MFPWDKEKQERDVVNVVMKCHEVHEAFKEQNQFHTRNQVLFVAKFPVFLCSRVHVKACSNTEVECLEIAMMRLSTQAASTGYPLDITGLRDLIIGPWDPHLVHLPLEEMYLA